MNEMGKVSIGIFTPDGLPVSQDTRTSETELVVVLRVVSESAQVGLCINRGDFSKLLALPNTDFATDVSLLVEIEDQTHDESE